MSDPSLDRDAIKPTRRFVFKKVGDVELYMNVFEPAGHSVSDKRAAALFFFGGGWQGGNANHFFTQALHLSKLGMVAMTADYRIYNKHGTKPYECVKDSRAAARYVRAHAAELGIDPNRIAIGGGSAGGHVASTTAFADKHDHADEDLSVSCRPDVLLLFNPVFDTELTKDMSEKYAMMLGDDWLSISPVHNINSDWPPTLLQTGDEDQYLPAEMLVRAKENMEAAGVEFDLRIYEGEKHGFFNAPKPCYETTLAAMTEFLNQHGFLD